MKKFTTLLLAILLVLPAMAVSIPAGTKLYLTPNGNWKVDVLVLQPISLVMANLGQA